MPDLDSLLGDIPDESTSKAIRELWRRTHEATSIIDRNVQIALNAADDLARRVSILEDELHQLEARLK
ncbi:MAG TPA: hypothetical protein VIF83_06200 [Gemmatimonadaceae bacterium]|jgi:hypothetical protein